MLPIAQTADPDALSDTIKQLRDTLDPDAADEAYLRALEQRDITLTRSATCTSCGACWTRSPDSR